LQRLQQHGDPWRLPDELPVETGKDIRRRQSKRSEDVADTMSAFGSKADINGRQSDVCF
jgi:hypothetical protein